jgi:hypothetical protein
VFITESDDEGTIVFDESGPVGRMLASLPPAERAERYREFANEAMQKAQAAADSEHRIEYLTMAAGWHSLASAIERSMGIEPQGDYTSSAVDQASRR